MNVVALVPRRADGGWRDLLWEHCRAVWAERHPDLRIVEGESPTGPFQRSAAINAAAAAAGDWDVAVVIDSDVIASPAGVERGVALADQTGALVISHDEKVTLNKAGTRLVLRGYTGSWDEPSMVERVWTQPKETSSCCTIVPRRLWDVVGGYDEGFVGWGFEDWAFRSACQTMSGHPVIRLSTRLYHLWHRPAGDANEKAPSFARNQARWRRYEAADGDPKVMAAVLADQTPETAEEPMIPQLIHRTVPQRTQRTVEEFWREFAKLHPGWELRTWREPLDPADFPLTSDLWDRCENGAQKAGLIRLELLVTHGGIYVDSDVQPLRPMEPLRRCSAFAGWEDHKCVPDAVLGAVPHHPAFVEMLARARASVEAGETAWKSGPGVTTAVLPGRDDVLLLPPGSLYPYHYTEKNRAREKFTRTQPWAFVVHHWAGSWLTPEQRAHLASKQKA